MNAKYQNIIAAALGTLLFAGPAPAAGINWTIPATDACARCAAPNASSA